MMRSMFEDGGKAARADGWVFGLMFADGSLAAEGRGDERTGQRPALPPGGGKAVGALQSRAAKGELAA